MVAKTGVTPHSASTDDELGPSEWCCEPWAPPSLNYHPLISILIIVMMITTINPNGSSRTGPYDDDNDLTIAFAHDLIITAASNGQPAFLIVTNIYIFFSFTFSRLS